MTVDTARLGVIGGSGLYEMLGLTGIRVVSIATPFGMPSDDIVLGTLEATQTAFLPRHGRGHRFTPSEVPYRANVWALKKLGCGFVLSVSATGSMKEEIAPGDLVVVDQFIDRTVARTNTFFGDGVVAHVGFSDPTCETLRQMVLSSARATQTPTHDGGTYICIEGPTFSTKAESRLFRSWGVSVVGMTNLPEARLAREAGMSYATLALATDYDCWHESEEAVSVEAVVAVLQKNVGVAREVVRGTARLLADQPQLRSPFESAAQGAVMTSQTALRADTMKKLQLLLAEQLG
jgi:5'-methylthioadenosine phosphorylase